MKKCIICFSSERVKSYYKCIDYEVVKCSSCGLVFVNKEFPDNCKVESFSEIHRTVYANLEKELKETARQYLELMSNYIAPPKTLLDIGCSYGYFMEVAKERGYDVYGVDIQKVMVEKVREKGLTAYWGGINELKEDLKFDIITAWNVIEHLNDPKEFLFSVRRHLNQNGFLFIETPNNESLAKALSIVYFRLTKPDKRHLKDALHRPYGGHSFDFSPKNIGVLLNKTGFHVLKIQNSSTSLGFHVKFALASKASNLRRTLKIMGIILMRILGGLLSRENRMLIIAVPKQK